MRAVEEQEQVAQLLGELVGAERRRAAAQRGRGDGIGAGRAPEAEIDATGMQRLEHPELLGDDERRVVGQHHAARADADRLGRRREVRDRAPGARSSRCRACCGARPPTAAGSRAVRRAAPARPSRRARRRASIRRPRERGRARRAEVAGAARHQSFGCTTVSTRPPSSRTFRRSADGDGVEAAFLVAVVGPAGAAHDERQPVAPGGRAARRRAACRRARASRCARG